MFILMVWFLDPYTNGTIDRAEETCSTKQEVEEWKTKYKRMAVRMECKIAFQTQQILCIKPVAYPANYPDRIM